MEMSYKQASKIRQTGVLDSISKRLISGESIGSSVKSSIKESSRARAVGIKETFDPLNIAKVVTGGSNIGPALVGRMLGRSSEDLDYFTNLKDKKNKAKEEKNLMPISEITPAPETAIRIKPEKGDEVNYNDKSYRWMGGQWGEVNPNTGKTGRVAKKDVSPTLFQIWSDGGYINVPEPPKEAPKQKAKQTKVSNKPKREELSEALSKIYNLLQNSTQERKKSADLEKDLEEERKTEDERRHKELIEALLKIGGGSKTEKEKTSSLLSNLLGLLSGLFSIPGLPEIKGNGGESGKGGERGKGGNVPEVKGENKGANVPEVKGENKGANVPEVKGDNKGKGGNVPEVKGERGRIEPTLDEAKRSAISGKPAGTPPVTAERFLEEQSKPKTAEKVPEKPSMSERMKGATARGGTAVLSGALKLLNFLGNPVIVGTAIGYGLYKNVDNIITRREKNEIDDKQMQDLLQRELAATFSGVAGMELGAIIGGLLGAPIAAVVAPAGGVPGAFVEAVSVAAGAYFGYQGGDGLSRFLMNQFMGEPSPKVKLSNIPPEVLDKMKSDKMKSDFQQQQRDMRYNPMQKDFKIPGENGFDPLSSLQMESPSGELSKMAVNLTNENRDLNLLGTVAMAEPIILENNVNNMSNGKSQTRITSPDGSIRTTNPSINWSLKSNVRVV